MAAPTTQELLATIEQYRTELDAYDQEMLWDEDDRVQKEWFSEFSTNLKELWTGRLIRLNSQAIALSTPKQRRELGWPDDLHKTTIASRMNADEFPSARVRTASSLMELLRETVENVIALQSGVISCSVCGRRAAKECTGCGTAYYCGEVCQKQDWISRHRVECKKYTY